MPKKTLLITLLIVILTGGLAAAGLYIGKQLTQSKKGIEETTTERPVEPQETASEITSANIDTSDWKVYRNERIKFEIKHPGDWKIQEKPLTMDFLKKYSKDSHKLNCTFNISMSPPELLDQTLELHKYMEAGSWRKEEVILNGISTTKISYPEFPIAVRYFLKRTERVYYLIYHDATKITLDEKGHDVALEEHIFDPECINIFNQMLYTFEITR